MIFLYNPNYKLDECGNIQIQELYILGADYVTVDWAKSIADTITKDCVLQAKNLTETDGIDYICNSQMYYFHLCYYEKFYIEYNKH